MSLVTLIELAPRMVSTGAAQTLRFVHNARERADYFGFQWQPTIVSLPDFELDLGFDGARFGQGATPQVGRLVLAIGKTDPMAALVWKGALGSLRSAPWPLGPKDPDDGAFGAATQFRVESIELGDGLATLTLIDPGQELRRPAIVRRFGTSGNALLDSAANVDLTGKLVPTGWGRMLSVPGLLVDRANNIWLFLDRAASSVQGFYDGGAAFAPGIARADLAALQANSPAPGTVDYCLNASGLTLARPWTDPAYPFTADVTAGTTVPAAIAAAIVAGRTTLALEAGTEVAFTALIAAASGLYIDDERTIGTALDQIFAGLGGFWRLTSSNQIAFGRLAHATPAQTFESWQIGSITRSKIIMPTRRRSLGYAANNRVHSEGDIAAILLVGDIAGLGDLATQDEVDFGTQVTGPEKPEDGADVTANNVPTLSVVGSVSIAADWTGAVIDGQLPRTAQAIRKRGDTDVSATTIWSIPATQGCSASISSTGFVSITGSTAQGFVDVRSERVGEPDISARIVVNRPTAAAPAAGGTGAGTASDNMISSVSSESYGSANAGPLTVRAGASGTVTLTAPLTFSVAAAAPTGAFALRGKWRWRIVGGTFADVDAEISSSTSEFVIDEGGGFFVSNGSGEITVNMIKTGLTPSSDYEFELLLRTNSGTRTRFVFGTATAVAS